MLKFYRSLDNIQLKMNKKKLWNTNVRHGAMKKIQAILKQPHKSDATLSVMINVRAVNDGTITIDEEPKQSYSHRLIIGTFSHSGVHTHTRNERNDLQPSKKRPKYVFK